MGADEILVVGAGIGGLTAALALSGQSRAITIVERRTGFSEVGAGIQISPNASRVLNDLGLAAALRRAAAEPPRVVVRSLRSGREIGVAALGPFARQCFEAPYYVVHRADLQTVLLDAVRARPNIKILLGRTAVGVESLDGGARLRLEKTGGATEALEADMVVGADGLRSTVRRALRIKREPAYRGYTAWRSTIPRDEAPQELAGDETGLWLGRNGHVVHYPVGGGRRLNIVAVERRPEPVEGWSAAGDGRELLDRFKDAAAPLRALIGVPQEWLLWSLFDLPAGRMRQGHVALLGDAAHPVLPFLAQGAALAIEDATVLARAVAHEPNVAKALGRYERERLRRVRKVQRAARRNGSTYHAGGLKAFVRNAVMRRLGPEGMTRRYSWIYGWRPDS